MPPEAFRWMTAEEWDRSDDVWQMLHNAKEKTGDLRKLSFFGTACCWRHECWLLPESRAVLSEFEILLDQLPVRTRGTVLKAGEPLCRRANDVVDPMRRGDTATHPLRLAVAKSVCYAVLGDYFGTKGYFTELDPNELVPQLALLRDIFGNPFRPVVFDPAWCTSTAVAIAKGMYDSRDFSAMPILADALQDAGCENDDILNHCRDPQQVHVRGCWVVDLVLGKS